MIITRSPLRITLGGGGTDLPSYYREHTGFLIAAAIDKYVYITAHRSFERALADEWNRAKRHEQPLALVLLDLDYFKDLNDRRGHPAGDDCLRKVGAFLAE